MKPELKRIELALQQASKQYVVVPNRPTSAHDRHPASSSPTLKTEFLDTNTSLFATNSAPAVLAASGNHSLPSPQENHHFVTLTNSALSVNLLQDLQTMVAEWGTALETVLQQIQVVYEEGPIVNGWLESCNETTNAAYRLCGLDEEGQIWNRACPPAQVPDISLAIVRYQRLQTLLARKQSLENRLSILTETLVDVHGRVTGE